jgi:hypothetical protein
MKELNNINDLNEKRTTINYSIEFLSDSQNISFNPMMKNKCNILLNQIKVLKKEFQV